MNDATTTQDDPGSPPVVIYTTLICPFCHRAKHLLKKKGVKYREIDVTLNPGERLAMRERSGGSNSVPQIFIGDRHIGGCDDLFELEFDGDLDALLTGNV
ncbi:MAG: glutaredoxin 3 [Alphaproteobacteria bacterium]|nr:glutaredoxin 3 [Alphaproteobacteria bacterium]